MQEALVQVWRSLPSYRSFGSFKAWLIQIVLNQARKYYRRKRLETMPLENAIEVPGDVSGPEEALIQKEDVQRLRQALKVLSTDHREVLILRYYADLTVPEIAKALGCREGTVKSRLSRALDGLEGALSAERSHATGGGR
jgi:RNA polymerase sigma-70 factor (ECF subfamily)